MRITTAFGFLCAIFPFAVANAACEEALVRATYQQSSAVHTDYRLATLVTQSVWDEASHNGGAQGELYGVPIGASYSDYQKSAAASSHSLNESYTHDQLVNIAWSGLDPNAPNAYRACLENTLMQANGLQAAVVGADQSNVIVLIHWFLPGNASPAHVVWAPASVDTAQLQTTIPQGYTTLVIKRPTRAQSVAANYNGYTTDILTLYPYVSAPTPLPAPKPVSATPKGWYGFSNAPNKDRDGQLKANCTAGQTFNRVPSGGNFSALCSSVQLECKFVCDWEGHTKPCGENPNDGSRLAMCQ